MRQEIKFGLFAVIGLALLGCEPSTDSISSAGDGRKRLSVNNSYGEFGDYVIHVNAMTTASLTPEIAQSYGITRSENTGLINLVVLQKAADGITDNPVQAKVELSAANLTGQLKSINLREVEDATSIYYVGQVSVDDKETINFDFDVVPAAVIASCSFVLVTSFIRNRASRNIESVGDNR